MQSLDGIAVKHCKKTEVQLVLASRIMEGTAALENRWLNMASLPKTHTLHCVIPVCRYVVKCSTYSSAEHFNTISLHAELQTMILLLTWLNNQSSSMKGLPKPYILLVMP